MPGASKMGKRGPEWEWRTLEEDAVWPPPSTGAPTGRTRVRGASRRWWWVLAIMAAVIVSALIEGYREVHHADQVMTQTENEVRATVAADIWMAQHTRAIADASPAPNDGAGLARDLGSAARRVEVRGAYAMVEVWTTVSVLAWLPAPYRQTRFYQESAQGWRRVDPPDVFFAPTGTLTTGRFTFVYGVRDANAVQEAAQRVEEVDADLRAELGLPGTDEALEIKVVGRQLPSLDPVDLARLSDGSTLYVPSPALLALPGELSESDALLQLIAGLLVTRNLDDALAGAPPGYWPSLSAGLRLWLVWEQSTLPSPAHHQHRMTLQTLPKADNNSRLACFDAHGSHCAGDPTGRAMSAADYRPGVDPDTMMTTLVEYAVSAYGGEHLPALLDGMRRFATWDDLIPAVYGVSAAEFEAGWQDYLRATYSPPRSDLGRDE